MDEVTKLLEDITTMAALESNIIEQPNNVAKENENDMKEAGSPNGQRVDKPAEAEDLPGPEQQPESPRSPAVVVVKKSRRWYKQKFNPTWLKNPELASWIARDEKDKSVVRCTVCDCKFKCPNLSGLRKHKKSAKHAKMMCDRTNEAKYLIEIPVGANNMNQSTVSTSDQGSSFIGTYDERQNAQERVLLEPYSYIQQVPGKQIRIKLTKAFNHWMEIPNEKLEMVSEIVQMLHNASLLIDDIEDNSKLRRGIPVAHSIFGTAQTINAANYVYFLGLQKTMELGHPEATRIFMEQLLLLHQGQGMDIWWRDSYVCPTEDEYKAMVLKKTGGLFGLAVRLMQLFSENKCDFKPLSDTLGLYFQIRDDLANLQSHEYAANKSYCEDLTEGKFSFPIIHGILSQPNDNQIINILRKRTTDDEIKKYCVEHLKKIGSFDHTKKVLAELEDRAFSEMSKLGTNPYLEAMLEELSRFYKDS